LWIDAISINQADVGERGIQVGLMKDIFELSNLTVVWLGEESHDSNVAMQLAQKLANASQERYSNSWSAHPSNKLPPLYDSAWTAFANLLQRPWWHRAWVVQEASVTRHIQIMCGRDTISWNEFARSIQYAVSLGFLIAHGGSTTFQALRLFETRGDFQNNRLPSLHEILLRNRSFKATDARDKVFGLLSLANPEDVRAMDVRPNYHLSVNQLYESISRSLLKRPDLSAFDASCVHLSSSKQTLPSWVSDWSVSDPSAPLTSRESLDHGDQSSYMDRVIPEFSASGSSVSAPIYDNNNSRLGLEGIFIDQIETIGTVSRTRYLRHVSHMFQLFVQCRDILEQLKNWEQVAQASFSGQYLTGERRRDAYWFTLCAGRVPPNLIYARKDPRYKYYLIIRSLRSFVKLTIRWFPRSEKNSWYNRLFYSMFQTAWRTLGLTPTKIQRIGFPPQSRLSNYRRMIRTKKGYIGLAPRFAEQGDWVGVFKGGKLPLVIRKEGDYWILIGESYVHGIMKGEAWDEKRCKLMWFE
jgi:hypothetical protein